jgi:hypothetical protein
MLLIGILSLVLRVSGGQSDIQPPYEREGDRVEREFRVYQEKLSTFFGSLRGLIEQQPVNVQLPRLQDLSPVPVSYGLGVLPRIVDATPAGSSPSVGSFSYSWPVTEIYIRNEEVKLDQLKQGLEKIDNVTGDAKTALITNAVREYRKLFGDQRTVEQYIQYNRFWQRSIAQDRSRFDQLTRVYELMTSGQADVSLAIREVLGKPDVPSFIQVNRQDAGRVSIHVPVYTDIDDQEFLAKAKSVIEETWQARENETNYALEIEIRKVMLSEIYRETEVPQTGAHVDARAHAARFPADGAVLTTGAQTTHSLVGRYVALGPGDLSTRTLAHEFGHVLGFRDGYIRGYRDLGDQGFEIRELTSVFDDIMSAPREGHVQPTHFKLMIDAVKGN